MPGKPAIFGSTKEFLNSHNLNSLNQLPKLDDIIELSEQAKAQLGLPEIDQEDEKSLNMNLDDSDNFDSENIH